MPRSLSRLFELKTLQSKFAINIHYLALRHRQIQCCQFLTYTYMSICPYTHISICTCIKLSKGFIDIKIDDMVSLIEIDNISLDTKNDIL